MSASSLASWGNCYHFLALNRKARIVDPRQQRDTPNAHNVARSAVRRQPLHVVMLQEQRMNDGPMDWRAKVLRKKYYRPFGAALKLLDLTELIHVDIRPPALRIWCTIDEPHECWGKRHSPRCASDRG